MNADSIRGLNKRLRMKRTRRYMCHVCCKIFKSISVLHIHSRIHTGERPYACSICGKKFVQLTHVRTHEKTHKNIDREEKDYSCNLCPRKFSRSCHLQLHQRFHLKKEKLPCDDCDKIFYTVEKLEKHQETHKYKENDEHASDLTVGASQYDCDKCGKKFAFNIVLQIHKKTHLSTDVTLECIYCGEKFEDTNSLKSHAKCHTGERPYVCKICCRNFRWKGNLDAHKMSHLPGGQLI